MIIASVIGDSEDELILRARLAVQKGADIVELRIDNLELVPSPVHHNLPVPTIITQRPMKKELLGEVLKCADLVDIDLAESHMVRATINKLIISKHLEDTPGEGKLLKILEEEKMAGADICKLVTTATSVKDNLVVVKISDEQKTSVVFCQGGKGTISRVLAARNGMSYACLGQNKVAEGQIDVEIMKRVGPETEILCVIGDPIVHSLSPDIHNPALREIGVDCVYIPVMVEKGEVADFVNLLRELPILGANVTIPNKIEVMKHLDEISPEAEKIGAVNTIVKRRGKLIGYNTDRSSIVHALGETTDLKGKNTVVLGAGGAARAVVSGLRSKGANVTILNRTEEKAKKLAKEMGCKASGLSSLKTEIMDADILINCTSVGLDEDIIVPPELLQKDLVVLDMVYRPGGTPLIQAAKEKGCTTIGGERILVLQAEKSFELFTGRKPPAGSMEKTLEKKMKNNLILVGPPGGGKSSVGKELAKITGRKHLDTDTMIEETHGKTVPEIIREHGEIGFRRTEAGCVIEASRATNSVISTGGGVICFEENRERLKESGTVIMLNAPPALLASRIPNLSSRPLLKSPATLEKLIQTRMDSYLEVADCIVDTSSLTVPEVAEKIREMLK